MKVPWLHSLQPFSRILFSILLIITCFLVLFLLSLLIALPLFGVTLSEAMILLTEYADPKAVLLLKYFQIVQEIGIFILPPLLAAFFFAWRPIRFLRLDSASRWEAWGLTVLIMCSTLPAINYLIELNEAMTFPEWMEGMEIWMQETEIQARDLTDAFLKVNTTGGFLMNLLMIAVLPAVGEELLFRGLFQRLFYDWLKNIHVAILLGGILFGAMHLQFYGIVPRAMLGILFGYLFYWSGSLWIPIFAHFLNNAVAVTISFLERQGVIGIQVEELGRSDSLFLILTSVMVTGLMLFLFRYLATGKPSQNQREGRSM